MPRLPDDLVLPPEDALAEAQRLIDAGRPFHAHEVLEAVWKTAAPEQRDLWRGLAQLAVGLTHLQRGNRRGAVALLRRGADLVGSGPPAYGVATERLADEARRLAAAADRADDPSPQARLDLRPAPSGGLRPSLDDDREPGEEVGE